MRTPRRECLDHILVFGERHPERVLEEYVRHHSKEPRAYLADIVDCCEAIALNDAPNLGEE